MSDADKGGDEIGSLADEASKLLGVLSGWAREHAGEAGEGFSGLAAQTAESGHHVKEHCATDSAGCTACPLCRSVHAVRQLSPEVMAHLAAAATSLAHAAAALVSTHVPRDDDRG